MNKSKLVHVPSYCYPWPRENNIQFSLSHDNSRVLWPTLRHLLSIEPSSISFNHNFFCHFNLRPSNETRNWGSFEWWNDDFSKKTKCSSTEIVLNAVCQCASIGMLSDRQMADAVRSSLLLMVYWQRQRIIALEPHYLFKRINKTWAMINWLKCRLFLRFV